MRALLARLLQPTTCGHKLRLVASHKAPDIWNPDTQLIIPGPTFKTYQECGLRPGHEGEHGGWQRFGRIRLRLANWIYP